MVFLVSLLAAALVVATVFAARNAYRASHSQRDLLELGRIGVPVRLENRNPTEAPDWVVFHFDSVANSFLLIGSNTPIQERLTVATWAEDHQTGSDATAGEFRATAIERVEELRWRRDGDYEIGDGVHRVNTHATPAWVLLYRVPGQPIQLGYMVWQKLTSLEQAKALVLRVAGSFARGMPQDAFFTQVRERPAKLIIQRRAAADAIMKAHGLAVALDGPPVEQGDTVASLRASDSPVYGAWLLVLHHLGSREAGRYRQDWSNPPRGIGNWPDVMLFRHDGRDWVAEGTDRTYALPSDVAARLARRHVDPGRVYFHAVKGLAVDETPPEISGLGEYLRVLPEMAQKFAAGGIVERKE